MSTETRFTSKQTFSLREDGNPLVRSWLALVLAVFFPIAGLPVSLVVARQERAAMRPSAVAELAVRVSTFLLIGGTIVIGVLFFQSVIAPGL